MSVNYNLSVLANRLQLVVNAIDAGPSNGYLRLLDGGGNTLSSFQLSRPCATVSGNTLTFAGLSLVDPAAAAGGTVAAGRAEDSTGTIVFSGLSVGGIGSGSDIILTPTTTITAGQTVAITAATITGH